MHPWEFAPSKEDGTRLSMTSSESKQFVDTIHLLLSEHNIAYIDLIVSDSSERIKKLLHALHGKVDRNSCNLNYYKELGSSKKQLSEIKKDRRKSNRKKSKTEFENTNVAFFIDIPKDNVPEVLIYQNRIELSSDKVATSRFTDKYGFENLASIHFDQKLRPTEVQKILLGKIYINGDQFSFLGCSAIGLKSRNVFLWRGSKEDVKKIFADAGNFEKISSKSKRMARVGLLFSEVYITDIQIDDSNIIKGNDIMTSEGKYNFSDGCGKISSQLAKSIYAQMPSDKQVSDPQKYAPSVFQIRLQGIKGVVAIDPSLKKHKLLIRPSMIKFETESFPKMCVCEFSRPYTFGYLNRQLIYLLSGLGVEDKNLLEVQEEYFEMIRKIDTDVDAAVTLLQWNNKFVEAETIAHASKTQKDILSHDKEMIKFLNSMKRSFCSKDSKDTKEGKKEKLRILIKKSRRLFGVCDETRTLKYGQCFLRVTIDGVPKTITGKVVSGRTPCYLLGDIKVLEAIDVPGLDHLVDCVVFPTKGKRPHADEQSGGDLDGDKFFITWDQRLVPPKTRQSHDYTPADIPEEGEVTLEKMIHYFSIQNEAKKTTGVLANLYESWADLKGPCCNECEQIGKLFGRAIDATKTGEKIIIPKWLNKKTLSLGKCNYIWQQMEENAKVFKSKLLTDDLSDAVVRSVATSDYELANTSGLYFVENISEEYLMEILSDNYCNITEFQKFILIWLYARAKYRYKEAAKYINENYIYYIKFSMFSSIEKHAAVEIGVPVEIVCNALNQATIFPQDKLEYFNMLKGYSAWGLCYQSSHDKFNLDILIRVLMKNTASLISFRLPDGVVLVFQFDVPLRLGEELVLHPKSMSSFMISKQFKLTKKFVNQTEYFYDLFEDRFQVYKNGTRRQSFLYLKCDKFKHRVTDGFIEINYGNQDLIRDCLSVDLTTYGVRSGLDHAVKHPLVNKCPFTDIEVHGKRGQQSSYVDVYVANELDDFPQESDDSTNFEDKIIDDNRDLNELILSKMENVETVAWSHFKLKKLLSEFVVFSVPVLSDISSEAVEAIIKLVGRTNFIEADIDSVLSVMISLSRLQQHNILEDIVQQVAMQKFNMEKLVKIISNLNFFWYVKPFVIIKMITNIKNMLITEEISTSDKWLLYNIWNCIVEFLNEIDIAKKNVTKGAIDFLKIDPQPDLTASVLPEHLSFKENNSQNEAEPIANDSSKTQSRSTINSESSTHINEGVNITLHSLKAFESSLAHYPSVGDFVLVMRSVDLKKSEWSNVVICLACVVNITPVPLSIKVRLLDEVMPSIIKDDMNGYSRNWVINTLRNANIVSFTRVMKAVQKILEIPLAKEIVEAILGNNNCSTDQLEEILGKKVRRKKEKNKQKKEFSPTNFPIEFNSSQVESINAALNNTLTIIQGPPGSGKTKVACAVLKEISNHVKGVLAVAETNMAVDNLCKGLIDMDVQVVRLGNIKDVARELYACTLEGKLKYREETRAEVSTQNVKGQICCKTKLIEEVLKNANVIVTTCSGAGDERLNDMIFPFVLADEATQIKERTLLCPLSYGVKQLVLIGDPCQLNPLVNIQQTCSWISVEDLDEVREALRNTLFHKLQKKSQWQHFLDIQYRMHPKLAEYPSSKFYLGALKSGVTEENRKPPWDFTSEPSIFMNIFGKENRSETSFVNKEEVEAVKVVVEGLLTSSKVTLKDVVVLALCKAQVLLLRKNLKAVEVNSIDGFQGREAEIIVASTVRCTGELGKPFQSVLIFYIVL